MENILRLKQNLLKNAKSHLFIYSSYILLCGIDI